MSSPSSMSSNMVSMDQPIHSPQAPPAYYKIFMLFTTGNASE